VVAVNWVERRRSFVYPALMSLGVGVLASCAEKAPPAPPQTVAVEPPPPPPPPPPPRRRIFPLPARKPTPPPENLASGPESSPEAMALASPEPIARTPNPEPVARTPSTTELIGLDQPAATHLFGAATEQSEAPPATIWHYRSDTCELDLFFYLDLRSGKMRTLHYAFKGEPADPNGRQDCLRSLIVARGG
jgi:outer membrane biosynthesis protein TonB